MPEIEWTDLVDMCGRWFFPMRKTVLPEIQPLPEPPKKGTFVNVYKAEVMFQYQEEAVPPDESGEVYKGRELRWTAKRSEAANFIETKSNEAKQQNEGKVLDAKIYRVDVKVTPMKEVMLKILNKEGVDGDAYVCWQLNGTNAKSIKIGAE